MASKLLVSIKYNVSTSNTGSWSFDQRVRGGTPSFMARESFARNVSVTLPTLGEWDILGIILGHLLGAFLGSCNAPYVR